MISVADIFEVSVSVTDPAVYIEDNNADIAF